MGISAIIIAKNEEKNIKKCFKALRFVNEIILIDNNSQDKTGESARKLKAQVFKYPKIDFSEMRKIAKDKAKYEWLLYIDVDEEVSAKLAGEIKRAVGKDHYSAYEIIRQNYYFGSRWPNDEKMIRLIKKDSLIKWYGQVHETPEIRGRIGLLKNPLLHFTHSNLAKMVEKTNSWSEIESELRLKSSHPPVTWWRLLRVMLTGFWRSFVGQKGYKAGTVGAIESIYQSFSLFITYAKLWEKQQKKS